MSVIHSNTHAVTSSTAVLDAHISNGLGGASPSGNTNQFQLQTSTLALHRENSSFVAASCANSSVSAIPGLSSRNSNHVPFSADIETMASKPHVSVSNINAVVATSDDDDSEVLEANIADETFTFFTSLSDSTEPLFTSTTSLQPSMDNLGAFAKTLLRFCCSRRMSAAETAQQYEFVLDIYDGSDNCAALAELKEQFSDSASFCSYVERARKGYVNMEGWQRAIISTAASKVQSGIFRDLMCVLEEEVMNAGGASSVLQYTPRYVNGQRVRSSPIDSDAFRYLYNNCSLGIPIIAFDVYADGTTLAKSGAQSACVIRMRLVNVRGRSSNWHDIAIAPTMPVISGFSAPRMSEQRAFLLQLFLFVILRRAMVASKTGVSIDGTLLAVRLCSIVADQPQERALFGLKKVGSFMDCSQCMRPTRQHSQDEEQRVTNEPPEVRDGRLESDIYTVQTSRAPARARHVSNTVARQLIVATSILASTQQLASIMQTYTSQEATFAKSYLYNVSAGCIPPALAAFYGLGTAPFHLYRSIALDKLHVFDLGVARMLPDFAFRRFAEPAYHKNLITKAALVRIANQRFTLFARPHGIRLIPFRLTAAEVHANMTGAIRRSITPFLWTALLGLQPDCNPYDDILLQAALLVNHFQVKWRGINTAVSASLRTQADIDELSQVGFTAGVMTAEALSLHISTKLHRLMHHSAEHVQLFGCTRRCDTDKNESLHKATKACYNSTNKHLDEVPLQLVKLRSAAAAVTNTTESLSVGESDVDDDSNANPLMLTDVRSSYQSATRAMHSSTSYELPRHPPMSQRSMPEIATLVHDLHDVLCSVSNAHAKPAALSITRSFVARPVWTETKSVRFDTVLPWNDDDAVTVAKRCQVAYAGENIRGTGKRFDAVRYSCNDRTHLGIIHMILQTWRKGKHIKVVIVRRLQRTMPHPNNTRIVTEFGHERLKYAIRPDAEGQVLLDTVLPDELLHIVAVVPDMHDIATRFSIDYDYANVPDDAIERKLARFFLVRGVQLSAVPEISC